MTARRPDEKPTVRHLRHIEGREVVPGTASGFPFTVPAVRTLEKLDFDADVTFFVGANGSGKSTVLEAIGAAAALPTVGAEEIGRDGTLASQRKLAKVFKLVWNRRTRRGFFLRAEDFFGFVKRVSQMRAELTARLAEIDVEFRDASPFARGLAAGPVNASLSEMTARYGVDLDANSHGETFLKLFQSRFVPGGLYLMDEPEAALSPQSQLGLLALLAEMVQSNSQFIIATHSPILLAFPGARIYSFDETPAAPVGYEDLEHVNLTRSFLSDPGRYLRHLMKNDIAD
jgi:predicted ATPase